MTAEFFDDLVNTLCENRPFRIFTIELNGGERIEIDHPRAMINKNGFVMFFTPGGKPMWFDHNSVNKIVYDKIDASPQV